MGIYKGTKDIKEILFKFADTISVKRDESEYTLRGFLYRKTTGVDSSFFESGRWDRDNEFHLVADDTSVKKGDILTYRDKNLVITEVAPLCITDDAAGISAKAVLLKNEGR